MWLPYACPLDHVLNISALADDPQHFGWPLEIREAGFTGSPRVPDAVKVGPPPPKIRTACMAAASDAWQHAVSALMDRAEGCLLTCRHAHAVKYRHTSVTSLSGCEAALWQGCTPHTACGVQAKAVGVWPAEQSAASVRTNCSSPQLDVPELAHDRLLEQLLAPLADVQVTGESRALLPPACRPVAGTCMQWQWRSGKGTQTHTRAHIHTLSLILSVDTLGRRTSCGLWVGLPTPAESCARSADAHTALAGAPVRGLH